MEGCGGPEKDWKYCLWWMALGLFGVTMLGYVFLFTVLCPTWSFCPMHNFIYKIVRQSIIGFYSIETITLSNQLFDEFAYNFLFVTMSKQLLEW